MGYMNNLVHNQRLSNIELLRIIAMLMIMLIHLCCAIGSPNKNDYTNHHPFWHTITIKAVFSIGFGLFHEINAAVAVFSCFSIVIMAAVFAFSVKTVADLSAPRNNSFLYCPPGP